MAEAEEDRWDDLVADVRQENLRFGRGGNGDRPGRQWELRHRLAWLLLGAAYAILVVGMATDYAPFVILGVVLASAGGLYDYRWAVRHSSGLTLRR